MYESVISEYCKKENMEYGRYIGIYLTSTLFKHHLWDYFKMTFIVCAQSLVVSIFIQPTKIYMLCWCIAFGIYMSTIFLLIYSKKICCSAQCRIPMLITGTVLLGNVVITNIMFYGQQRYVVYTFGFFYISLFILGKEVLGKSIKKQQY